MSFDYPIAVISFNRPAYLKRVLLSVKGQKSAFDEERIALFQDGAPAGHDEAANKALIEESIDVFKEIFPKGKIFLSKINLGIGMNIDRAERWIFEDLQAEAGFFLEDDLELGSSYFDIIDALLKIALQDGRIGYVSAFGNYRAPLQEQLKRPKALRPLHLLWGFGLTRRHWQNCRPYVLAYLDLIRGVNYRSRDHDKIRKLTASWGVEPGDTAQDRIKSFATAVVGAIKVNTEVSYAKYIGELGFNFDSAMYEKWGFKYSEKTDEIASLDFDKSTVPFEPWGDPHVVWKKKGEPAASAGNKAMEKIEGEDSIPVHMTPAESQLLRRVLKDRRRYLEYGCGGSTALALENPATVVISVESDAGWINKLRASSLLSKHEKNGKLIFCHANIGPIGDWGAPAGDSKIREWNRYWTQPWTVYDIEYDFILVDGRFRVATALFCAKYARPGTTIAIHDYFNRPWYFVLDKHLDFVEKEDNLAIFKTRGTLNERAWLLDYTSHFLDVR